MAKKKDNSNMFLVGGILLLGGVYVYETYFKKTTVPPPGGTKTTTGTTTLPTGTSTGTGTGTGGSTGTAPAGGSTAPVTSGFPIFYNTYSKQVPQIQVAVGTEPDGIIGADTLAAMQTADPAGGWTVSLYIGDQSVIDGMIGRINAKNGGEDTFDEYANQYNYSGQ